MALKTKKSVSSKQVKIVASLAHIGLRHGDIKEYREEMLKALPLMASLDRIDTQDVIPTAQITPLLNVTREDVVKQGLTQRQALRNATGDRSKKGYFKVKPIQEISPD